MIKDSLFTRKEDADTIPEKKFYRTEFINESAYHRKIHSDGLVLCEIPPGGKDECVTDDPRKMYARFNRITFRSDGSAKMDYNKDWKMPTHSSDVFPCEIFNDDGHDIEVFYVNEQPTQAYRQIPMLVYPKFDDRFALYASVQYVRKEVQEPSRENPYYLETVWPVVKVITPKPKETLEKIKALIVERGHRVPRELDDLLRES